jgi:hypothetical protein
VLYKFSNKLSTINSASNLELSSLLLTNKTFSSSLAGKGINEHSIVLSFDEAMNGKSFLKDLCKVGLIDIRVPIVNQIMYTFHREQIYLVDASSKESWFWTTSTFKKLNPLLKYDYGDSKKVMVISEIVNRILRLIGLFCGYW